MDSAGSTLESSGVHATFYPNHRNFTIAGGNETRVYSRFIGAVNISQNSEGIRALRDLSLRSAIEVEVQALCGARPRELWLTSAYHEPKAHSFHGHAQPLTDEFDADLNASLPWLESLAPRRSFHTRHSVGMYLLNRLTQHWQWRLSTREARWQIVSYEDAWTCEQSSRGTYVTRSGSMVPQHTGAIQRGYWQRSYCCFYLSMLRTLCALDSRCGARDSHAVQSLS